MECSKPNVLSEEEEGGELVEEELEVFNCGGCKGCGNCWNISFEEVDREAADDS